MPSAAQSPLGICVGRSAVGVPLTGTYATVLVVAIRIERVGNLYRAEVSPPHAGGSSWTTPKPMTVDDLIAALRDLGCHQTDIGDALYQADPEWQLRS